MLHKLGVYAAASTRLHGVLHTRTPGAEQRVCCEEGCSAPLLLVGSVLRCWCSIDLATMVQAPSLFGVAAAAALRGAASHRYTQITAGAALRSCFTHDWLACAGAMQRMTCAVLRACIQMQSHFHHVVSAACLAQTQHAVLRGGSGNLLSAVVPNLTCLDAGWLLVLLEATAQYAAMLQPAVVARLRCCHVMHNTCRIA